MVLLQSLGAEGGCCTKGSFLLFPWQERSIWGLDGAGGMSKLQHSSGCCGDAAADRESQAEPSSVIELKIQTERG